LPAYTSKHSSKTSTLKLPALSPAAHTGVLNNPVSRYTRFIAVIPVYRTCGAAQHEQRNSAGTTAVNKVPFGIYRKSHGVILMSSSQRLVAALKRALKQRGITYADVASAIDLSEASVKRCFAANDFSLERLESIAHLVDMDLIELARAAEADVEFVQQITLEQEAELVADQQLLLTAYLLLNGWTPQLITTHYQIDELPMVRLLARLDRMKLIELLPANRVRLRTAPGFRWHDQGPIIRYFNSVVRDAFIAQQHQDDYTRFVPGMITDSTAKWLREKLEKLANDFADQLKKESQQPVAERQGVSLLLSFKAWELPAFAQLRRKS
jgi:transcriptional regulator with XRE-family HTH domain